MSSATNQTSNASVSSSTGFIFSQAGPTVACARADTGVNVWSAWGGWEVWSTPLYTGFGTSAIVYFGSDSYSITALNAATGKPVSWYTTGGNIVGSAAVWDGKLYVGSYDNKVYCFEDHATQETTISASVDTNTPAVDQTVTVTATLAGKPEMNVYDEIGAAAPIPPMPNTEIIVTVTDPEGVTSDLNGTTNKDGVATVTFEPDAVGTWKVLAVYMGEDGPVSSRTYSLSDEIAITVGGSSTTEPVVASVSASATEVGVGESVTLTASVSGGTGDLTYTWYEIVNGQTTVVSGETSSTMTVSADTEGTFGYYCEVADSVGSVDSSDTVTIKVGTETSGIPMEYIYALVGVIAIVVIVVVAYMFLKKRK
jgi:hypothetical protein